MVQQVTDPVVAEAPKRMTYEEYLAWAGDDVRAEWVDGEVVLFMPVGKRHVLLISFLFQLIGAYARLRRLGEVYGEPFEQWTRGGRAARRPDVVFVATDHLDQFGAEGFAGAVDLAVEVVSEDSEARDRREKRAEYAAVGVPEYWIVEGREGRHGVAFLVLQSDGTYAEVAPDAEGWLRSTVLPGFWLDPAWLEETPLPNLDWVLEEIAPGAHGELAERARQERAARERT